MANTIRIKRRASGAIGAPSSLANAELAFNEVDDTLYYGKGAGGAGGTATTVEAIGGKGAVLMLTGNQSVGGQKTFTDAIFVPTPTHASHAVTKAYADAIAAGTNITLTGDITGTGVGSVVTSLADVGTAGTYTKVTTDSKGRVTAGSNLAASDIPSLTAAKVSDFDTQVRTSRLDQMAAPNAPVSMAGNRITNVTEPVNAQDAATKNYVDLAVQGLDPKQSVRAATTGNLSLLGLQTIDGVVLADGDRVLVKDQTTAHQNGIYIASTGAWSRTSDADAWDELVSAYVFVEQGTVNGDNGFLFTVDKSGVLGSTAVTVVQFSGAAQLIAGNGLTKTGNQLDVGAGTGIAVAADTVGLTGQALALHNLGTNGIFVRTAAGTVAARSVAVSGTGISVSNGDGVSGNPTLSLTAALAAIGAVTPAADRLVYFTGAAAAAVTTFTSFARSLMDDTDAASARTTLGLGSMATQAASAVAITGGSIDGITFDGGTF
jgi:phage-related tail fiber protein